MRWLFHASFKRFRRFSRPTAATLEKAFVFGGERGLNPLPQWLLPLKNVCGKSREIEKNHGFTRWMCPARKRFQASVQCKMKKTSSFMSSPMSVFGLSSPLLLASVSLILAIICKTFTPE